MDNLFIDILSKGLEGINLYFGGKLLQSKGVWVATDRLGSVRANSNGERMSYFPYGEERTSTADGREKFGTYTRDGLGQDYAEQRYYSANAGSFWTPDPGGIKTASSSSPSTWNRYAYVAGDPVNFIDPHGRVLCAPEQGPSDYDEASPCDSDPFMIGCGGGGDAPPLPDQGAGGPGGGGGEDFISSITTAGQAKQGLIQAFTSLANCAGVLGGMKAVDKYANSMTFLDGTQPGTMGAAGANTTQTFANFESQTGAFAATLTNSSGNLSSTVVLFANFFGNVANGNPLPLDQQDEVLIHEFIHSMFNLGHDAIVKKFGIKVSKNQNSSQAIDQWIGNDCKTN